MRVAIIVLGVLLCSAATAEPQPWMRKENPDRLYSSTYVTDNCPLPQAELQEIVNGVIIRSRLRPGNFVASSGEAMGVWVEVKCIKAGDQLFLFHVDASFIRPAFDGRLIQEFSPTYPRLGRGEPAFIKQAIRDSVEELVTDYLQANFDLTPE